MKKAKNSVFPRHARIALIILIIFLPSHIMAADVYEPDDSYTEATEILIEIDTQTHDFHDAGDQDWYTFNIPADSMTVDILVANPGSNCDAVLELYGTDGTTRLFTHDETGNGVGEVFRWSFMESGDYYLKARQSDPNVFDDQTHYEFSIFQPVAGFLGFVTGRVTNAITGNPIVGALIKTDDDVVTGSLPNGAYLLMHMPGEFEIAGEAPGYGAKTYSNVVIVESDTITRDIRLYPLDIDTDGDGVDDHEDNCPIGSNPEQNDFDGDGSGDMCDNCPTDKSKTEPGDCGCDIEDTDVDEDGIPDCIDRDIGVKGSGSKGDCFISTIKN